MALHLLYGEAFLSCSPGKPLHTATLLGFALFNFIYRLFSPSHFQEVLYATVYLKRGISTRNFVRGETKELLGLVVWRAFLQTVDLSNMAIRTQLYLVWYMTLEIVHVRVVT